jgi:hypothetical protein
MCKSRNLPILVSLAVVISLFCYTGTVRAGVPPPANDLCVDAIGVGVSSSNTGSTIGATDDGLAGCGDATSQSSPGVWYTVTGTGNTITASTCNMANFDTELSVWCGDCADLTCVAGNDDGDGCSGFTSQVSWCSQAGATYQILVYGWAGATGGFTLGITDNGSPCEPTVVCEGGSCEEAQIAAQDAVESGGPYRNHGKLVKTAAKAASPFLKSGAITEECDSCIVNQFARNIPIYEQEVCTDAPAPTGCCLSAESCEELTEQDCPDDAEHEFNANGHCIGALCAVEIP